MGGPGLAGPVGLDPADRLRGGPPDGTGVAAAQIDGQGVLGAWTVTTRPAWMRPRAIFCPTTMITPVLLARR